MAFRDAPIRRKLVALMLATSTAVLLLSVTSFVVHDLVSFRRSAREQLATLAEITAENSTAALAFANPDDAAQILAALRVEPNVLAAGLYDRDGRLFARYPASADGRLPATPRTDGFHGEGETLAYVGAVAVGGKRLGTLHVLSDTSAMRERLSLYAATAGLLFAVSFLFAVLLSRVLEGQISSPIVALAGTARAISDRHDYTVRATKVGNDEVGLLTDAFNQMLERIARQDQALRDSEERLNLALRSARVGTWTWSIAADRFLWDDFVGPLLGRDRSALPERYEDFLALLPAGERESMRARVAQTIASGAPLDHQFRVAGPDGAERHLAVRGMVYRDGTGEVTRMAGAFWDVTEARLAQEAVRRSNAKFQRLVEANIIGVILTRTSGEILEANDAFLGLVGYSRAELEAGELRWDLLTPPEWREVDVEILAELRGAGVAAAREKEYVRKDGSRVPILLGVAALEEGASECVCSVVDLTDRKAAQRRIEQYALELKRSNEQLEQFAYVASHDLQEPLRMVASYTQLLERRYAASLDEGAREFIAYAVDGARRMQRLINDLLEYSRVNTRTEPCAPVDLGAVLDEVRANLRLALAESGAEVKSDVLPTVWADATQMSQLFQNLIGNAIKFRGAAAPRIEVRCAESQDEWRIALSDNGIGIAPEYFDRVFVIFQRLHAQRDHPGSGIGLAICKRIVERHGGRIWVESSPGEGTTFHFTIAKREGRES